MSKPDRVETTINYYNELERVPCSYKIIETNGMIFTEDIKEYIEYLEKYNQVLEDNCFRLAKELDEQQEVLDNFRHLLLGEY